MGNGLRYANFHKNLFSGNETTSFFCPSLFPKRPIHIIPDTKSVIVCSIWYYGDGLPYRRTNKATTRTMDR